MVRITFLFAAFVFVNACETKKTDDTDSVNDGEVQSINDEQPVVLQEAEPENPDSIITDDWGGNAEWELAPSDSTEE